MKQQTENLNGVWRTENLKGELWISKPGIPPIYRQRFTIPANKAVEPEAEGNILCAAGCDHLIRIRCRKKHSMNWNISTRAEPNEIFCFRRADFPDILYRISLENDHSPSYAGLWSDEGTKEYSKEDFLKDMSEKRHDGLTLWFCTPGKLLPEINRITELRYLALMECYFGDNDEVFREIGRMEQLRGLRLHGACCGLLNTAAVGELRKLKKLETLCVRTAFPISIDAVRELRELKNLKALHLDLWGNCHIEHERRAALVSALSSLQSLEKWNFWFWTPNRTCRPVIWNSLPI